MLISRLYSTLLLELKALKFFGFQLFMVFIIMPVALLLIMLAQGEAGAEKIAFASSGFMAASMVGVFVATLAMRIANMMMPEILELYATFSLKRWEMVAGMTIAYILVSLPQTIIAGIFAARSAPEFRPLIFFSSTLVVILSMALVSVWLGLLIKNAYTAMGLLPFLSWILIILSPMYYKVEHLPVIAQWILLINPMTHYLALIRHGLGITATIPVTWSLVVTLGLSMIALASIRKELSRMFILEKF